MSDRPHTHPSEKAQPEQGRWTPQERRDVHSLHHFLRHLEAEAAELGLHDSANLLAMAALAIEDELAREPALVAAKPRLTLIVG